MTATYEDIDTDSMDDDEIDAWAEELSANRNQNMDQKLGQRLLDQADAFDNRGGYVTIYDTLDGCPSQVLEYMVPKLLKERRQDDRTKRRFSKTPKVKYYIGDYKCYLHKDHPMRKELDGLGLAAVVCKKDTLRTEIDVDQHMRTRHKRELRVIEESKERARRKTQDDFQNLQMEYFRTQLDAMNQPEKRGPGRPPKEN